MVPHNILSLTDARKQFITQMVNELAKVDGIQAVVLGGSHATGRANENSDIDLGLYYEANNPFSIDTIREFAKTYSEKAQPTVVDFYQWGPWVNGGAWLHTSLGKVDLLYRNIDHIKETIANAQQGKWENHYAQQPPYGFSSMIYLAECKCCVPLFDPGNVIQELKMSVSVYPKNLKDNVVNDSLWSAEFTIAHAETFAAQNDLYTTMGCFARSLKNIAEALFALNEIYPIGDKQAIPLLAKMPGVPNNFPEKVNAILTADSLSLNKNVVLLRNLFTEVVQLTGGSYQPKFIYRPS